MDRATWRRGGQGPCFSQSQANRPPTINRGGGHQKSYGGDRNRERGQTTLKKSTDPDDASLFPWFRQIPKTGKGPVLGRHKLGMFFKTAAHLVEQDNDNISQQIITKLSTAGGLLRIAELTMFSNSNVDAVTSYTTFEELYYPFLKVVGDKRVLDSRASANELGIVYNCIYGVAGRNATTLFSYFAKAFRAKIEASNDAQDYRGLYIWAVYILRTLAKLLASCQSASLHKEFKEIVDAAEFFMNIVQDDFKDSLVEQEAKQDMKMICQYLDYGTDMSVMDMQATTSTRRALAFELEVDGPGTLSSQGPRHNNDHEDIESIKILPTMEEILSERSEYLPTKEPASWHVTGMNGLIDRQFRLLREDTVGQLRDCVRSVMDEVNSEMQGHGAGRSYHALRFHTYRRVLFGNVTYDRKKRLHVVASFDQPHELYLKDSAYRKKRWDESRQLQVDALVCVVDSFGHTLFFSVCERNGKSDEEDLSESDALPQISVHKRTSLNLWSNEREATITLRLIDLTHQSFTPMLGRLHSDNDYRQTLVEFPGVILPSFKPTLEALQRMVREGNTPFSGLLAPQVSTPAIEKATQPPRYSRQPHFTFDLESILTAEHPLLLRDIASADFDQLLERSTLDKAQAGALVRALLRDLALIQGPPGTGKSFVAVQMVKVLLQRRVKAQMGPIIIVCYTNHALDQFLEQLNHDGVDQIIRIGSRSKSPLLEPLNLRLVVSNMDKTKTEKHMAWQLRNALEALGSEIEKFFRMLRSAGSQTSILTHLQNNHPHQAKQLETLEDEEGFRVVSHSKGDNLQIWLSSHKTVISGNVIGDRSINELQQTSLHEMITTERRALYAHWKTEIITGLEEEVNGALEQYTEIEGALQACNQEIELRCLRQAHIVGVTTSGLAQKLDLLRRLKPKVLVCEEAGEILEAHTLTAFLPSIEHAVLIGDHEQLRPQVQNYGLSLESRHGEKYSLDVSTFERLVSTAESDVPCETLQTQRRMDPSISDLIRQTIYPELIDHDSVLKYPKVNGIRKRLFWLDHREMEVDRNSSSTLQPSHSNDYEVELVEALVTHIIRQGVYKSDDIIVLTPYVRQLQKIRTALSTTMDIIISDRDINELEKQGFDDGNVVHAMPRMKTHRAMLDRALRVATVDNFQGEEAKVVIISLVRSNLEANCGFLRTTNRINVLLSRAKHGMYIIGNSATSRHVPMWAKVFTMMEQCGLVGPSLPLNCPNHPDTPIEVQIPQDFLRLAPEGGCDLKCEWRLDCGHQCTFQCHSSKRHAAVICQRPCERSHEACGHSCTRSCGLDCGDCLQPVKSVTLNCGHIKNTLPCYQTFHLENVVCGTEIEVTAECGHTTKVPCGTDPSDEDFACKAPCEFPLSCGHDCGRACHQCRKEDEEGEITFNHGKCKTECNRPFKTCNHTCRAECHPNEACQLCGRKCEVQCHHSKCIKFCSEPCAPCAEKCTSGCFHMGFCQMPCAVPCDVLPCSRRCEQLLACGHQCPSLCGEACPDNRYCQVCAEPAIQQMQADLIMFTTYGEVDLNDTPCLFPDCGHIITVESADGYMDISQLYTVDCNGQVTGLIGNGPVPLSLEIKGCPQCRGSLRNINRYSRFVKRALLDESTKRFITWSNSRFVPLASRLQAEEERLKATTDVYMNENKSKIRPTALVLKGNRRRQVADIRDLSGLQSHLGSLLKLRTDICKHHGVVCEGEQPYAKVESLALESARKTGDVSSFTYDRSILQTRAGLLTGSLLLRSDYDILSAVLHVRQHPKPIQIRDHPWLRRNLTFDMTANRRDCVGLLKKAAEKEQPMVMVQARILFAKFVALERSAPWKRDRVASILDEARGHVQQALTETAAYPSIAYMKGEVEDVQKMLREGTFYTPVTTAELQAVYNAMATEFSGTGHWYYCVNMHLFTVGECGMPMQSAICPQCGAGVGGQSHQSVEGVTRAADLEQQFGQLRV